MRYIYQNVVQDGKGNFISSANITVTLAGTSTKASIYSAVTGGVVDADGVVVTDSSGTYAFYVDEDDYSNSQRFKIVMSKTGYTSETWDYVRVLPSNVLDEPAEWTAQQNFNESAITSASNAAAWDLDAAQCAVHTMTENTTISAPTNMNAGGTYILRIVQAAGVYTLAFNAVFDWGSESAPAAPAANGDVVVLSFYSDGSTMYGVEFIRKEA